MSRFFRYIHGLAILPVALSAQRSALAETAVDDGDEPTPAAVAPPPEAAAPDTPSEPAPDYTPAFERLFALGLPDSRGGRFVKPEKSGSDYDYTNGEAPPELSGFAWRMPASGDAAPDYVINGVARFAGASDASAERFTLAAILKDPTRFAPSVKIPKSQAFTEADLAKEVASAHQKLADWKRKKGDTRSNYDLSDRLASYVILAAHASRHGHTDAANKLAHLALTTGTRRRGVVAATTSVIAEARWNRFLHTLTSAPVADTKTLETELAALIARFSQGWNRARAAEILLSRIRSATTPSTPALPGRTFTPEQLRFAADLLTLRTPPPAVDWLAPANAPRTSFRRHPAGGASSTDEKSPVIDFLRNQGPEALPLLAALADDNSITPCVPAADPNSVSYRSLDYIGDGDDENAETPWRIRNSFSTWENRPKTRGEIARSLLASLEGMNFENGNDDAYVARVLAAYDILKTEGRIGFLIKNTRGDSPWERRNAWQSLIGFVTSDSDCARIEQAMLESPDKQTLFNDILPRYLGKRAGAAAPFFKKFTESLRAEIDELDDSQFSRKSDNDFSSSSSGDKPVLTRDAALAAFDAKVADLTPLVSVVEKLPPDKRLARILDNVGKGASGFVRFNHEEFSETVAELGDPWTKVIPDILARSAKSDREEVTGMLLNLAQMASALGPDDATPLTRETAAKRFTTVLPHWNTLLASAKTKRARQGILLQIENMHPEIGAEDRPDNGPFGAMRALEEEEQQTLYESRFAARIAGKPLPPWPSASRVPAEKLTTISGELAAIAPEKLAARYATLSADERLAWAAHLESTPKSITPSLERARALLAAIKPAPGDATAAAAAEAMNLREYTGHPVDAAMVRAIITRAAAQKPAVPLAINLTLRPYGRVAYINSMPESRLPMTRDNTDKAPRMTVYYQRSVIDGDNGRKNESASARFEPGAASLDTAESKDFWKKTSLPSEPDEITLRFHLNITLPGAEKPAEQPKN